MTKSDGLKDAGSFITHPMQPLPLSTKALQAIPFDTLGMLPERALARCRTFIPALVRSGDMFAVVELQRAMFEIELLICSAAKIQFENRVSPMFLNL